MNLIDKYDNDYLLVYVLSQSFLEKMIIWKLDSGDLVDSIQEYNNIIY